MVDRKQVELEKLSVLAEGPLKKWLKSQPGGEDIISSFEFVAKARNVGFMHLIYRTLQSAAARGLYGE